MARVKTAHEGRLRRHLRVRKRVFGTAQRPRLDVFRSLNHIYAQVIDDARGHTLAAASSGESGVPPQPKATAARQVGQLVAARAKDQGVGKIVFDRGGYKYHGRIKQLAEGAREGGLDF